jgi:hypothetical protein
VAPGRRTRRHYHDGLRHSFSHAHRVTDSQPVGDRHTLPLPVGQPVSLGVPDSVPLPVGDPVGLARRMPDPDAYADSHPDTYADSHPDTYADPYTHSDPYADRVPDRFADAGCPVLQRPQLGGGTGFS